MKEIKKKTRSLVTISFLLFTMFTPNFCVAKDGDTYLCKIKSHFVISNLGGMSRKSNLEFKLQWIGEEITLGGSGIFMNPRMKIKKTKSSESFHAENLNSAKFLSRSILSFINGQLWFTENYGELSGVTSLYAKCKTIE